MYNAITLNTPADFEAWLSSADQKSTWSLRQSLRFHDQVTLASNGLSLDITIIRLPATVGLSLTTVWPSEYLRDYIGAKTPAQIKRLYRQALDNPVTPDADPNPRPRARARR